MFKKFRIIREQAQAGFFSNFLGALKELRNAEIRNQIPIIHWGDASLYFEPERGQNVWEYYFQPVSPYPLASLKLYHLRKNVSGAGWSGFPIAKGQSLRFEMHLCWKRYVKPKPDTWDAIESFYLSKMAGHHVLGVHVRGTDRKDDQFTNDAGGGVLALEVYLSAVRRYLERHKEAKVFLATDDADILAQFEQEFVGSLITYEAIRSRECCGVHSPSVAGSPFQKGQDVLVEATLLARCNYLFRCTSNVSAASLCFNPELQFFDFNASLTGCRIESWLGESRAPLA